MLELHVNKTTVFIYFLVCTIPGYCFATPVYDQEWEIDRAFEEYKSLIQKPSEPDPLTAPSLEIKDFHEQKVTTQASLDKLEQEWSNSVGGTAEVTSPLLQMPDDPTFTQEMEEYKPIVEQPKKPQTTPIKIMRSSTPIVKKKINQTIAIQQDEQNKMVVSFGGYIKPEAYWDTRQIVADRDGEFLYYPDADKPDVQGRDINSRGEFDMITIQTRLNALIKAPRIADSTYLSGFVEIDFFGVDNSTINTPRMRHAWMRINRKESTFLFGYYWHPIVVEECNAMDVVSFNEGVPFESFSRNPQIRYEYNHEDKVKFIVAALTEVDFKSTGTDGDNTKYLRNSLVPILHAQVQGRYKQHCFGVGVDFRRLKPRLESATGFKVDEHVNSVSALAYVTLQFKDWVLKTKATYASNDFSYLMVGGYGIHSVNPITEQQTYTPIRNIATWLDFSYGKVLVPGLFFGFLKNLGAPECLAPVSDVPGATSLADVIYGRGKNIDWLLRASPRLVWNVKNLQVCGELEVTHAEYGTIEQNAKVCGNDPQTNVRVLLATFYYF